MLRYYPIPPTPAPRQVRSDAWKPGPRVLRYRAFRDEVALRKVVIPQPFAHVIFLMKIPNSWAAAKQLAACGMPHQQKPDRDNLEKALLDSVFGEDCTIWDGRSTKLWAPRAGIVVSDQYIHAFSLPVRVEEFERFA